MRTAPSPATSTVQKNILAEPLVEASRGARKLSENRQPKRNELRARQKTRAPGAARAPTRRPTSRSQSKPEPKHQDTISYEDRMAEEFDRQIQERKLLKGG